MHACNDRIVYDILSYIKHDTIRRTTGLRAQHRNRNGISTLSAFRGVLFLFYKIWGLDCIGLDWIVFSSVGKECEVGWEGRKEL
jgi:hypothetical protein